MPADNVISFPDIAPELDTERSIVEDQPQPPSLAAMTPAAQLRLGNQIRKMLDLHLARRAAVESAHRSGFKQGAARGMLRGMLWGAASGLVVGFALSRLIA